MSERFRASQGHLNCVLAVAIVIVLLIPAIAGAQAPQVVANASSCGESHILSKRLAFADLHRAQKTLGHKDQWARQLSDFDIGARQKTAEPTDLKEFLEFAAHAGRPWTGQEEDDWQAVVGKLSDAMKGLNLHVPNIDLVKTSGREEFGAAYTRRDMLPMSMILADNFATLMEWRSDGVLPPANPDGFPTNDIDLLTAMEGVLASGCTTLPAASLFQYR